MTIFNTTPQQLLALQHSFDMQYAASRSQLEAPLALRRDRLRRLRSLIETHAHDLTSAVSHDFGMRSSELTEVADLFVLRAMLHQIDSKLDSWMCPQPVFTPFYLQPAKAYLMQQPLGVVGVMSPWNYPVQLALGPVATALAAGNRVMLKPSELTPETSGLLARLIRKHFSDDELCVHVGATEMAKAFAQLPFDHLVFTGSTQTGRLVAQAAAKNLTPTTLELGGKSPCIVDASAKVKDVALKIAHGKLLNAGQTCIAPDYVLLPRGREGEFAQAYRAAVARLFPTIEGNADYASIITPRHHARLRTMLQQAQTQGAEVQTIDPAAGKPVVNTVGTLGDGASRQMLPTLVFGATSQMQLMQEEIFGPILPVISYERLDDAIAHINAGPRPLALYWFGQSEAVRDDVLRRTVSGGVTVNDTLMHIAHDNLPFGGVGDSGWGAYHGEQGFLRFCHQKSVLVQSRWAMGSLFYPPYGARFDQVMGLLRRWL